MVCGTYENARMPSFEQTVAVPSWESTLAICSLDDLKRDFVEPNRYGSVEAISSNYNGKDREHRGRTGSTLGSSTMAAAGRSKPHRPLQVMEPFYGRD